jgi:hypothetical protein
VSLGAAARSADDLGFVKEVLVQAAAGVEDLEADEAVTLPVERDEGLDARRGAGLDGGAARREWLAGEVEVDGVGRGVVGDPDAPILPCASAASWRYTRSESRRLRQRKASLGVLPSLRLRS